MTVDLERLGQERRLIFENVCNGVPIEKIMVAFHRSELEVTKEVAFVARKIREYRFRRRLPPLRCETMNELRWNRLALLETVSKLGPLYLSSELLIPRVHIENLDHAGTIKEVAHRIGAKVT